MNGPLLRAVIILMTAAVAMASGRANRGPNLMAVHIERAIIR